MRLLMRSSTEHLETLPKHSVIRVFSYSDPVDYLQEIIKTSSEQKLKGWTLAAWSRRLGYRSARSLGMILKRQRRLTEKMAYSISKSMKHTAKEARYFDLIVRRDQLLHHGLDTAMVDAEMQELRARAPQYLEASVSIQDRVFSYISNWYHLPIKQLIASPGFVNSIDWIRLRLRQKVTGAQVIEAIQNMLRVGVIVEDKERGYRVPKKAGLRKIDGAPSLAVRQHHVQMIQRAADALKEQGIDLREFLSWTLRVDPERLPEMKECLRQFGYEFNSRFFDEKSNHVFQLNMQFFEHTRVDD